jgi:hypothetical protein
MLPGLRLRWRFTLLLLLFEIKEFYCDLFDEEPAKAKRVALSKGLVSFLGANLLIKGTF